MKRMTFLHGSPEVVALPKFGIGNPRNDYGLGFYCTQDWDLAAEWACPQLGSNGFVNKYSIDADGLSVVNLDENPHGTLGWIATLMSFRRVDFGRSANKEVIRAFIDKYQVQIDGADIVIGFRADDGYYDIARTFVSNGISLNQLDEALHLGNLGTQVVIKSERAFKALQFGGAAMVQGKIWHPQREQRNIAASLAFKRIRGEHPDSCGVHFLDIEREIQSE